MNQRESIWPLTLGLVLSLSLHVGGALGWAYIRQADQRAGDRRADLVAEPLAVGSPRRVHQPVTIGLAVADRHRPMDQPFSIRLEIDDQPFISLFIDQPLAPGDRVEKTVPYTADRPGLHQLTLIVDADGQVDESDESNNRREETWLWVNPDAPADAANRSAKAADVDLSVEMLDVPEPRLAGKPAQAVFEIANLGPDPAPPFICAVLIDHQRVATVAHPDVLAAGETARLEQPVVVNAPGEHELTIIADPFAAIAERNERNNEMTGRFTWKASPSVGGERDDMVVNMIDRDEYEKRIKSSRTLSFDQPLAQMMTEPADQAPVRILDPTPPLPRLSPADSQTRQAIDTQARLTDSPPDPAAPEQPAESVALFDRPSERDPATAPAMSLPADRASAAVSQSAPVKPTPIEPTNPPAKTPALVLADQPPSNPRLDRTAFRPMTEDRQVNRLNRPIPSHPGGPADLLEPSASDRPGSPLLVGPRLPVDPQARPTDRTVAMNVEPTGTLRLPSIPVRLDDHRRETGSPQSQPVDQPPSPQSRQPRAAVAQRQPRPQHPAPAQRSAAPTSTVQANPTSAPRQDLEAEPVSMIQGQQVQAGNVLTVRGVKIRTVAPRISLVARYTTAPRDPIVRLTFDENGKVINADILRSTGYANVDGPILTSLLKWTAEGNQHKRFVLDKLRIILGVHSE